MAERVSGSRSTRRTGAARVVETEGVSAAGIVDAAVRSRAVLLSPPPPEGRSLEVLVAEDDRARVEGALAAHGYEARAGRGRGRTWARFADCDAEVVHLRTARDVGSGDPATLQAAAGVQPGRRFLAVPGPADELLVVASRALTSPYSPDPRLRRRVAAALRSDPDAWSVAGRRAAPWGLGSAVEWLHHTYLTGEAAAELSRAALHERGDPPPVHGAVLALSGLDGAGKSTQARALARTLDRLGYDVQVEWTRISFNASLRLIAAPVKSAVRLVRRGSSPSTGGDAAADSHDEPARQLRDRLPWLNWSWAGVVAVNNALAQRRSTLAHVRRGRVVLRDRYVLDSAVHLREAYGDAGMDVHIRLVELLSPTPLLAYLVAVPGEVAFSRKQEEFTAERLVAQAARYDALCEQLGVVRLDGELPADVLAARIARDVWRALP